MGDMFTYAFMQRAFLAGLAIAVAAPLIGSFIVIRRLSLIADTLAHVALTGVALGLILGISPTVGVIAVTLAAGFAIERLRRRGALPGEAVLAVFLPGGLAMAIMLIRLADGASANLSAYLFGSIVTVSQGDLAAILSLAVVIIGGVSAWYGKLLYASFDEDDARVSGVPVDAVNALFMVLTALTVAMSIRIVGALLTGALMVIPVLSAFEVARSFRAGMGIAVAFAVTAVAAGLTGAYLLDLPAGAAIVASSLVGFVAAKIIGSR